MPAVVLLSTAADATSVLPSLGVLEHPLETMPLEPDAVRRLARPVVALVDGRGDPVQARAVARLLRVKLQPSANEVASSRCAA